MRPDPGDYTPRLRKLSRLRFSLCPLGATHLILAGDHGIRRRLVHRTFL